jgi:hypothetical protein
MDNEGIKSDNEGGSARTQPDEPGGNGEQVYIFEMIMERALKMDDTKGLISLYNQEGGQPWAAVHAGAITRETAEGCSYGSGLGQGSKQCQDKAANGVQYLRRR